VRNQKLHRYLIVQVVTAEPDFRGVIVEREHILLEGQFFLRRVEGDQVGSVNTAKALGGDPVLLLTVVLPGAVDREFADVRVLLVLTANVDPVASVREQDNTLLRGEVVGLVGTPVAVQVRHLVVTVDREKNARAVAPFEDTLRTK